MKILAIGILLFFASSQITIGQDTNMVDLLKMKAWEVKESPAESGYEVVLNWMKLPDQYKLGAVSGVAVDSKNRVYVFHRGKEAPSILCFENNGNFLFSWDKVQFENPHMIVCDAEDNVWVLDDGEQHVIYKLSDKGEIVMILGVKGEKGGDKTHFDQPTDIDFAANGNMFVSDGYGANKRIVKLRKDGSYILEWGEKGTDPGQFAVPHAVTVGPDKHVYVSDRDNWRVQVFDDQGHLLHVWPHIGRVYDLAFDSKGYLYTCDGEVGRITKLDKEGNIISFFGELGDGPGQLKSVHSIACDSNDDIIVSLMDGRVQKFKKLKVSADTSDSNLLAPGTEVEK